MTPDDAARFIRRKAAIGQHDIGRGLKIDDHVSGFGEHLAQCGAAKRVVRVDGNPQPLNQIDIACPFAHAARRSAMVVWIVTIAPPRITRTSALRPMLSPPK